MTGLLRLGAQLIAGVTVSLGVAAGEGQVAGAAGADNPTLSLGRKVYNFRCYYCHGYSGDAKTVASAVLTPPPRDFQSTSAANLPIARIEQVVRQGVPGTAMAAFRDVISEREIQAVARFVRSEFLERRARNTRYHTAENGWPDHDRRHADALPFARGEIALSVPPEQLPAKQRRGRQTYVTHCITCHDRGSGSEGDPVWSRKP